MLEKAQHEAKKQQEEEKEKEKCKKGKKDEEEQSNGEFMIREHVKKDEDDTKKIEFIPDFDVDEVPPLE